MIKKMTIAALAVSSFAAVAAGMMLNVNDVNEAVVRLLKPYNNESTRAEVKFLALDVANNLTQRFGARAVYAKVGKENSLRLRISKLDYKYRGQGGLPTLNARAGLKLDMVKAFSQSTLNELAAEAADMVKSFAEDLLQEYGEAATADAKVDALDKDSKGDVERVKLHVGMQIDLSKLPEGKKAEEVFALEGYGEFEITRENAELILSVQFNPKYYGYQSDQQGLKEFIEKLLTGDQKSYDEVEQYVGWVDQFAGSLVNRKAEGAPSLH